MASISLMLKLSVISCSLMALVTLNSSDNTSLTDQLSEHGMDLSFVRYNNMPHSCLLDKQLDCFLYTIPLTHSLMQMHIYCNYITRSCMCIILNIVNWNSYCYSHVYSIVINWACTVVHTHKHKHHYHNYQNYWGILQIFQWLANFNLANIGGQTLFNRFKMAGLILSNDDEIENFING